MSNRRETTRPDDTGRAGLSRRDFLTRAGLGLGAITAAPAILAACGSSSSDSSSGGSDKSIAVSSWSGYMKTSLLEEFKQQTGISVTYDENITDNNEEFAKIRPNLSKDQSIDLDGFVFTDWMVSRLINQVKWVAPFVAAKFPNLANLRPSLAHPPFDPDRKYSAPWASGMTGIAYNSNTVGGDIHTLQDFLNASGTKTVLTEMRDTVGLFMAGLGADPATATYASATPAFDAIQAAVDSGKINGFNGNEYVADLASGNLAAAFAWSGDVAQITLDKPEVKFVLPDSGGMLWSDNFMIPYTSDKVGLATEFINFFYDPKIAAELTAKIQYVSPVDGVTEQLTAMGGKAAALVDNPLVVPTEESLATLHLFGPLDNDQEVKFDKRFSEILGSG